MKNKELKIFKITSVDLDDDGNKLQETFEGYELKFPLDFTKEDVLNLLKAKYPNKAIHVMESMFPDTEWNSYIQMINEKIVSLDNDYYAQRKLIDDTKTHAISMGFSSPEVLSWYTSQNRLCMTKDPLLKDMDPIKRSILIENSTFWSTYGSV